MTATLKQCLCRSVAKSCLTLRPHGLQHARLLCSLLSPSLLKFMSVESVMLLNHLILCRPLPFWSSVFPRIRVFSSESALCIKWPKYWSFSISPSNEYSELISFRIDWLDLLATQGTLKGFSRTKEHLENTIPLSGNFLGEPHPSSVVLPLLFVAHLHPG